MVYSSVLTFPYFVALVEDIIFRGYLYKKMKDIKNSMWLAIIVTSLMFALFHIYSFLADSTPTNALYMSAAFIFAAVSCLGMEKIKHCTLLSVIIAHALHNGIMYGILF